MSVGLLIIAHDEIGQAFIDAIKSIMGCCPIRTKLISIPNQGDYSQIEQQASVELTELDTGQGVLILTDVIGSTPSNLAHRIKNNNSEIISGINLPMLLRIMNYPLLPLLQLVRKAVNGGKEGVIHFKNHEGDNIA